jgi:hypothetical protein
MHAANQEETTNSEEADASWATIDQEVTDAAVWTPLAVRTRSISCRHASRTLTDWTPGPRSFHVQGAVSIQPFDGNTDQLGGSWCYWGGPGANYSWTVHGRVLTLTPFGGKDACSIRGFIWTGEWTRVR